MPKIFTIRKYAFPIIGACILLVLLISVFYALMFGKEIFQGTVGDVGGGGGAVVQFDFQRMQGLSGISQQ